MTQHQKIGFIGLGVMGGSMAANLMAKGYTLGVSNRTRSRADALLAKGAQWFDSIASLCAWADIVITMVGFPQDVEQVYLSQSGILSHMRPGGIAIDMTTSKPSLARAIAQKAAEHNILALDAPVSGGDVGAKNATLSIMVGGDKAAFDAALPLFEAMGKNIRLLGGPGSGQHAKMCNQICVGANVMGVCEAMAYAKGAALTPQEVLQAIQGGAAGSWQLNNTAPRMLADDFSPGFYIKHFVKDLGIALEEAQMMGLNLPGLALVKSLYEQLQDAGMGDLGTQALYRHYVKAQ